MSAIFPEQKLLEIPGSKDENFREFRQPLML
jgi:hypothetical protein